MTLPTLREKHGVAAAASLRRGGSVCLSVLILSILIALHSADAEQSRLHIGDPPPDLEWTTVDGDTLSWDSLREGRPLVMVFWATWCAVCKKDWPKLIELADRYAESPQAPAWAAVSIGEEPDNVAKVAKERHLPGWIIVDPREDNSDALGIEFIPTVCVLDTGGRLAYMGAPTVSKLDRLLEELTSSTKGDSQ